MLKPFCGIAFLALSATSASAADYARPMPPIASPVFNWTGCYLGAHLGGGASEDRTISSAGGTIDFGAGGLIGGGQAGCDHQFASNWVVGAEGRVAGSSLSSQHASHVGFSALGVAVPSQFGLKNDFLASITARFGYAYGSGWLFYGRGGVAWTHEKIDEAYVNPTTALAVDPSASVMRTGWTLGAGVEWAFAPCWSANVEYNYHDFGTKGPIQLISPTEGVSVAHLKDTIHAATIGVNYHY
jgi:outer membrane immunogenic protein